MASDWTGVFPALMTEFTQDGGLDLDGMARHVESMLNAGVDGFVMLGTLGENASLAPEEKEAVLKTAVDTAAGRVPVLSGTAEYTSAFAIEHARRAERAGCAGLMVLPCMVYQADARENLAHFKTVAANTDLPIMVYNNPVTYGVDLKPEQFEELAECKTIVAIKESSDDVRRITDLINQVGDHFTLFCGVDDIVVESVMLGAHGWVAGLVNAFPHEAVQLYRLAAAGRMEEARALYRWFMPLLHLDCHTKLVQYIKLANAMTGEGSEWTRPPRLPLVGEERARIQAIIQAGIDKRPSDIPAAAQ